MRETFVTPDHRCPPLECDAVPGVELCQHRRRQITHRPEHAFPGPILGEGSGQHRRERGEELAVRQMLREHLDYGLSQCVGPLAGLVFLILVGAADDLHGLASSGSSMSSSSTSFPICWRSRSSCAINSFVALLGHVLAYGALNETAQPPWINGVQL